MPRCPCCGAAIDHLINWCKAEEKFIFRIDEKGYADYEYVDSIPKIGSNEFCCPVCQKTLFHDENLATRLRKGEITPGMWRSAHRENE